jgi:hypothetical protein
LPLKGATTILRGQKTTGMTAKKINMSSRFFGIPKYLFKIDHGAWWLPI